MSDVTRILSAIDRGDPHASEQLLPLVYAELRSLAAARMAAERPDHTLQATALVHEAYLRLVDVKDAQLWQGRGHFFGAAAEAMRRILVENARKRQSAKRGGGRKREQLSEAEPFDDPAPDQVLAVSEALDQLAAVDSASAELVKLRYFTGLTIPEIAHILGVSPRKADQIWAFARAWLRKELDE